jgi:hypothetical protein
MPESFIPVWMSVGEAENFQRTLNELDHSEAGLPERELSLIEGALERERPRTYAEMDAERKAAAPSPQAEAQDCERCGGTKRVVVEPEPGFDTKEPEFEPCPDCNGTGKQPSAETMKSAAPTEKFANESPEQRSHILAEPQGQKCISSKEMLGDANPNCSSNEPQGDVVEATARWIRERREAHHDHCGGEPTNPQFFGVDSEDDRAGPDGYCRGCWMCWDEQEIADDLLAAITPLLNSAYALEVKERPLDQLQRWTPSDVEGGLEPDSLGSVVKFADLLDALNKEDSE